MKEIPFEIGRDYYEQVSDDRIVCVETDGGDVVAVGADLELAEDWVVVDMDMRYAWYLTESDAMVRLRQIASESQRLELRE